MKVGPCIRGDRVYCYAVLALQSGDGSYIVSSCVYASGPGFSTSTAVCCFDDARFACVGETDTASSHIFCTTVIAI